MYEQKNEKYYMCCGPYWRTTCKAPKANTRTLLSWYCPFLIQYTYKQGFESLLIPQCIYLKNCTGYFIDSTCYIHLEFLKNREKKTIVLISSMHDYHTKNTFLFFRDFFYFRIKYFWFLFTFYDFPFYKANINIYKNCVFRYLLYFQVYTSLLAIACYFTQIGIVVGAPPWAPPPASPLASSEAATLTASMAASGRP